MALSSGEDSALRALLLVLATDFRIVKLAKWRRSSADSPLIAPWPIVREGSGVGRHKPAVQPAPGTDTYRTRCAVAVQPHRFHQELWLALFAVSIIIDAV